MFTHEDLLKIEWTVGRAFAAAKTFASPEDALEMVNALHILAEVRCAAQFLRDPDCNDELRSEVVNRLAQLFTHKTWSRRGDMFDHEKIKKIVSVAVRAFTAAELFADKKIAMELMAAREIFSKIHTTSAFLSDPDLSAETRTEIRNDLLSLIVAKQAVEA